MNFGREAVISDLKAFGRKVSDKALIWANSGNISHRLDSERILITGSGARLGELDEKEFAVVRLDSEELGCETKPSKETRMHTAIFKIREDVNSVFHSQAFFTTLISCTELEVNNNLFPESMAYIETIGRVPYHHPGSRELVEAVAETARNCDCIILSNHGAICSAPSLEDVLLKTETLEMLCRLIAITNIGNIELNYLPQDVKDDFLKHLEDIKSIK